MKTSRLVPWFGANALHAHVPAKILYDVDWLCIPFAGSMCEIPHFKRSVQIMVSDKHDELIRLARIVRDEHTSNLLGYSLAKKLFHPAELEAAKETLARARRGGVSLFSGTGGAIPTELEIAEAYFIVCWMGRSAVAGTKAEEHVNLALRYDAGGGDPTTRYHSAVDSLQAWKLALRRCQFTREDVFAVVDRVAARVAAKDFDPKETRVGFYMDPPWPDDGDGYLHTFKPADQVRLAMVMAGLPKSVHVLMRFGDHPLIRELYPESGWKWHRVEGRDQHRKAKAEVFLERGGAA